MSDPAQASSTAAEYLAGNLNRSVATGIVALGHDDTDALQLTALTNVVVDGDNTDSGVTLPSWPDVGPGDHVDIFNDCSAIDITVYARAEETIDGTGGDTGVTLTHAKRCAYYTLGPGVWVSAQLGAVSA